MIVDKPEWVSHGGMPIFSIDIDSTGCRVATSGQDNKARVWALGPLLQQKDERDAKKPKLLATLSDHCGPVNVVRFSKSGKYLVTGSDDKLVVVYQLHPGPGKSSFGSKDPPNVENWRVMHLLRGHDSNISDLSWCPDDSMVASASIDNTVIVWDVTTGRQAAVLKGHYGCVKGVAWDPFNCYLATQGEQDGVFIWRVGDWSLVSKIQEPFGSALATTCFHARLGWSPDGQKLAATMGYDKPVFQAPLIERNQWDAWPEHQYCGHKRPVCVAKFNPHLFYPRKEPDSDEACALCALGSSDKSFTVWSPKEGAPLLVGEAFFKGGVMDLAWTPDGYSLLVASYDGTIAVCRFEEAELGKRVPDGEVQELYQALYGNRRPGAQGARALVAGAELLALEAGAGGSPASPPGRGLQAQAQARASPVPQRLVPQPLAKAAGPAAAGAAGQAAAGLQGPGAGPQAAGPAGAKAGSSVMDKLSSRLGPGGGPPLLGSSGAAGGSAGAGAARQLQPLQPAGGAGAAAAAGPEGRKRLAPTPVAGGAVMGAAVPAPAPARVAAAAGGAGAGGVGKTLSPGRPGAAARGEGGPPAKRQALAAGPLAAAAAAGAGGGPGSGASADSALGAAGAGGGAAAGPLLPAPTVLNLVATRLGSRPAEDILGAGGAGLAGAGGLGGLGGAGSQEVAVELEASNAARDHRGLVNARLQCSAGGRVLWFDTVQGAVLHLAGTLQFCAATTAGGDLLMYSPGGRRLFPPIRLGCPTAYVAVDGGWRLMVVGVDARVRVWDVQRAASVLDVSAAPLLGPGSAVGSARLTHSGLPLLVMKGTHHAYTWHTGMACWMRVADDAFPASQFHSSFGAASGELGRTQAEVAAARAPRDVLAASAAPADQQRRGSRAHLECNIASALALESPAEWRRWLLTYVRQLAVDEDEVRLREVMMELLGPVRWAPSTHPHPAASGPSGAAPSALAPGLAWQPLAMGVMPKRQVLKEVLREVARARTPVCARLAQEVLEQLKEAEAHEKAVGTAGSTGVGGGAAAGAEAAHVAAGRGVREGAAGLGAQQVQQRGMSLAGA